MARLVAPEAYQRDDDRKVGLGPRGPALEARGGDDGRGQTARGEGDVEEDVEAPRLGLGERAERADLETDGLDVDARLQVVERHEGEEPGPVAPREHVAEPRRDVTELAPAALDVARVADERLAAALAAADVGAVHADDVVAALVAAAERGPV